MTRETNQELDHLLTLAADPQWMWRREVDITAALDRSVFSFPKYVIGDEIFWGKDRLIFVERLASN